MMLLHSRHHLKAYLCRANGSHLIITSACVSHQCENYENSESATQANIIFSSLSFSFRVDANPFRRSDDPSLGLFVWFSDDWWTTLNEGGESDTKGATTPNSRWLL